MLIVYARVFSVCMKDVTCFTISVHTCPLTGEFGIVYKAQLVEMGTHSSFKIVAVKTLKG